MDTINGDHSQSSMEIKSGPKMARKSSSGPLLASSGKSKSDSRYWLERGRLKFHDSPDYSARIQAGGKRVWFPLGSPNKKTAAAKAAEIYSFIQVHGLDEALEKFKPKSTEDERSTLTVGRLITTACGISSARRQSLDAYTKAFRRIVSEIQGITHDRKYDAHGGGSAEWRKKVDAVELHTITPADVIAWKNLRLRESEADPLAKRRAIVTVNSLIRNAKSLFGKKILPFLEQAITIPRPLPFDGVTLEKSPSMTESGLLPRLLLCDVKAEAEDEPEDFPEMKAVVELDWQTLIHGLLAEYRDNGRNPQTIDATVEAQRILRNFTNESKVKMRAGGELRDVDSYVARWGENAWRLALCLHGVVHGKSAHLFALAESEAMAAVEIVRWFSRAQLDFLAVNRTDRAMRRLERVLEILRAANGSETLRVLRKSNGFEEEELRNLAERFPAKLEIVTKKTGGRDSIVACIPTAKSKQP